MKTVRELLNKVCVANGNSDNEDDEFLFELVELSPVVKEIDRDEHRWHFNVDNVCKIEFEGTTYYIAYSNCYPKGEDADASDCGFVPNIDSMSFMYPHQVMTTTYLSYK